MHADKYLDKESYIAFLCSYIPGLKFLGLYQEKNLLEERDRSLDVRVRQADAIQARPRGRALHVLPPST